MDVTLSQIYSILLRIENKVDQVLQKEIIMAVTLDDVLTKVTAERTVIQSVVSLLQLLAQKLKDAIASGDPAKIQSIADEIDSQTQALSEAVVANTPAS